MKRIKKTKPLDKILVNNQQKINYPIFCFKYLQLDYKKDNEFYYKFIERIIKLSDLGWKKIQNTDKHSFGTEKIPVKQIKKTLPNFITPDIDTLTVFRANGDNRPFLGLRDGNVFHIIFLEEKFNDVYNHH